MILRDEPTLEQFRQKRRCEACERPLRYQAEPHHHVRRGAGGGSRIDHPWNLIALGGVWDCACHSRHHNSHEPKAATILSLIAKRENVSEEQITAEMCYIRNLPRYAEYDWTRIKVIAQITPGE